MICACACYYCEQYTCAREYDYDTLQYFIQLEGECKSVVVRFIVSLSYANIWIKLDIAHTIVRFIVSASTMLHVPAQTYRLRQPAIEVPSMLRL